MSQAPAVGPVLSINGSILRFHEVAEGETPDFYLIANPPGEALVDETVSMIAALPAPLGVLVHARLKELLVSGRLGTHEVTAVRAPHIYFDLLPCEAWVDLMTAFRAGDLDGVARFAHGGSFQG